MFETLQYEYIQRAFWASSIVGITCGLLGVFVTLRRMALIGDALSHSVLPGVVVAYYLFGYDSLAMFAGAVVAGISTSLLITFIQRNSPTKDDSSVGIVFTAMFSLGIIGISWLTKKQGVHLDMKDFLFGNVLGVTNQDLWLTFLIGCFVLLSIIAFFKYFFVSTFDPTIARTMGISTSLLHYFLMFMLSITIVSSLQSVGVILVVSMLIIPASTAFLLTNHLGTMLLISALIGWLSALSGLSFSILLETTPGPMMTISGTLIFVLVLFLSPEKGLLSKIIQQKNKALYIYSDDIIKLLMRNQVDGKNSTTLSEIKNVLRVPIWKLKLIIWRLSNKKLISFQNNAYQLTNRSERIGNRLLRSHRLWETFMSKKLNVPDDKLHDSAERMEHIEEEGFWDNLAKDLGNPKIDPHGSPIPQLANSETGNIECTLFDSEINQEYIITTSQQEIQYLWSIGLVPNSRLVVLEKNNLLIKVWHLNQTLEIPLDKTKKIRVKKLDN